MYGEEELISGSVEVGPLNSNYNHYAEVGFLTKVEDLNRKALPKEKEHDFSGIFAKQKNVFRTYFVSGPLTKVISFEILPVSDVSFMMLRPSVYFSK